MRPGVSLLITIWVAVHGMQRTDLSRFVFNEERREAGGGKLCAVSASHAQWYLSSSLRSASAYLKLIATSSEFTLTLD